MAIHEGASMTTQIRQVPLSDITLDAGTQMRAYMNWGAIGEYAELMKSGVEFDPVELMQVEDGRLVLINGFHRVSAAKEAKLQEIAATVSTGTLEEAIWLSIQANKRNGVRRSQQDIQRAIEAALLHKNGAEMSDRAIAEYVGCSHPTVGSVRAKLVATGKLTSPEKRKGKDGREISTGEIGLKHQLEHWEKLVYAPWLARIKGADLALIQAEDRYLHISPELRDDKSTAILQRYHLNSSYFTIRGGRSARGIIVDEAYVKLFERDGLKVYIERLEDLPKGMQSLAKAGFSQRGYGALKTHHFVPVDPNLKPGDLVARQDNGQAVVGRVVGRSESFVHVSFAGDDRQHIWLGSELIPLENARRGKPGINPLGWYQCQVQGAWHERYFAYKQYYAPEAIMTISARPAVLALGEDALRLYAITQGTGILVHDDQHGYVCILLDDTLLRTASEPIWLYETYNDPELQDAWRRWVAAATQPTAVDGERTVVETQQSVEQFIEQEGLNPTDPPVEQFLQAMNYFFDADDLFEMLPALYRALQFSNGYADPDPSLHDDCLEVMRFFTDLDKRLEDELQPKAQRAS